MLVFICHVLHIACTCLSLGGLFYSRVVLLPNLQHIPEAFREPYLAKMIRRFGYIKWTGIGILAITGIIQWLDVFPGISPQHQDKYIFAFIIKMIGAIGLLTITFLLALPTDALKGMQKNRAFWAGINLLCGLTILIGAAMMRAAKDGALF